MPDREKVIKGLECCCSPTTYDRKNRCPYTILYEPGNGYKNCLAALLPDALALLKEQEPVKPKSKVRHGENGQIQHWCGNCMAMLHGKQKYCSNCERQVKWE